MRRRFGVLFPCTSIFTLMSRKPKSQVDPVRTAYGHIHGFTTWNDQFSFETLDYVLLFVLINGCGVLTSFCYRPNLFVLCFVCIDIMHLLWPKYHLSCNNNIPYTEYYKK